MQGPSYFDCLKGDPLGHLKEPNTGTRMRSVFDPFRWFIPGRPSLGYTLGGLMKGTIKGPQGSPGGSSNWNLGGGAKELAFEFDYFLFWGRRRLFPKVALTEQVIVRSWTTRVGRAKKPKNMLPGMPSTPVHTWLL